MHAIAIQNHHYNYLCEQRNVHYAHDYQFNETTIHGTIVDIHAGQVHDLTLARCSLWT
jgi:hypothetical protein